MKRRWLWSWSALVVAMVLAPAVQPVRASGILGSAAHVLARPVAASNDLDARQGSIHERIRDAMEAGRLTDGNMHSITEQLQKVAEKEATFKAKNGEMSGWQTTQLQMDVDRISKELEAALTERRGGPVDILQLRNSLATRFSDALAVQKVTQEEYNGFFAELQNIDKQIEASKGPDGKMPTNDQLRIALTLDNLSQRFTAGEHQRKADMSVIDKRKDELRAMIREGVAVGQLTEDEVDDLRQQLYNFEDKEERMSRIGRPLTPDEEQSMALELERFGAEIRARMDNGTSIKITDRTVDHRKAALDQTFANALFSGDLTVAEATDFKNNIDQVSANEADLRKQNGGGLEPEQIRTLLITVEKLKGRFSRLTYNRPKPWGGVDGLVNDIKQKIAVAGLHNQLSTQESDDLQSKIADVLVAKSNERNTQGFVTTDSALKLQAEISTLSDQVSRLISERSTLTYDGLQKRRWEIDHSIAEGIDSGKLTPEQAAPLLKQYKEAIANFTKANTAAGADSGTLSTVSVELDNLAAAISQAKRENSMPPTSIDQLKREVDREITYRGFAGKLAVRDAHTYRAEYDHILKIEKASRASARGLDAINAETVADDLTRLLGRVKEVKRTAASP